MIEAALRYQTQGEDWIKRVGIGGAVVFLANLLFLPIFTVYGYMIEVMRRALGGDTGLPPEWDEFDIVQLSVNGAKVFVILFAYTTVIGLVLLIPSGVLLLLSLVLQSGIIGLLGILVGGVLSLVATLLIAVIAPVAIGNFVITEDITAGFDFDVLRSVGTNRNMLRAAGMAIVVNILISIVSGILLITIVGPAIVAFVGLSAVAYIWANGFADAYREEIGELPEIPDGPTKMGVGVSTDAGATAADTGSATAGGDTTTTGGTPDDVADTDEPSGPAPGDEDRWE